MSARRPLELVPDEQDVAELVAELDPGQWRAIRTGIYVCREANGRIRFSVRWIERGRHGRHRQKTFDGLAQAEIFRARLLAERAAEEEARDEMALWPFDAYVERYLDKHVQRHLAPNTQNDYQTKLESDVVPYFEGVRLIDIGSREVDSFVDWLYRQKTVDGKLRRAALVEAIELLDRVLAFAVEEEVLDVNCASAVAKKERRALRRTSGRKEKRDTRPITRREALHPHTVELIRLRIPGRTLLARAQYRLLISLLAYIGLRPSEAVGLVHGDWRTPHGPRGFLVVERGIADLGGVFVEHQATKTYVARSPVLWPAIIEELEALYELQGRPPLGARIFATATGSPLDFGNFRTRVWYPALAGAGLISEPQPTALGAIVPYSLRHTAATLLLNLQRHDTVEPALYSHRWVADFLGNTTPTLQSTYEQVMGDIHGVAGLTMDEAIRQARARVWGVVPGGETDSSYSLQQASELTGVAPRQLWARGKRGTLATFTVDGQVRVSLGGLIEAGLIHLNGSRLPGGRRWETADARRPQE